MNLYYNFYFSEDQQRMKELNFSLEKNLQNKFLNKVIIVTTKDEEKYLKFKDEKIVLVIVEKRPSYSRMVDIIAENTNYDEVNIIINSDCYLLESSTNFLSYIKNDEMWCLNKYDIINHNLEFTFHNGNCSQDCWVFRGQPKKVQNINFNFGVPGCDNRFAYESKAAGYFLKNPSLDVQVIHYHLSQVRTCQHLDWDKHRLRGNYEFIDPEKIFY